MFPQRVGRIHCNWRSDHPSPSGTPYKYRQAELGAFKFFKAGFHLPCTAEQKAASLEGSSLFFLACDDDGPPTEKRSTTRHVPQKKSPVKLTSTTTTTTTSRIAHVLRYPEPSAAPSPINHPRSDESPSPVSPFRRLSDPNLTARRSPPFASHLGSSAVHGLVISLIGCSSASWDRLGRLDLWIPPLRHGRRRRFHRQGRLGP